jgi:hypothetical protein
MRGVLLARMCSYLLVLFEYPPHRATKHVPGLVGLDADPDREVLLVYQLLNLLKVHALYPLLHQVDRIFVKQVEILAVVSGEEGICEE